MHSTNIILKFNDDYLQSNTILNGPIGTSYVLGPRPENYLKTARLEPTIFRFRLRVYPTDANPIFINDDYFITRKFSSRGISGVAEFVIK